MRTVINDLINGDSRDRLSILSDIATLTSFILVSLLAPAYSLKSKTDLSFSAIGQISIIVLLTVAGTAITLVVFISVDSWLSSRKSHSMLLRTAWWCVFMVIAVVAIVSIYQLVNYTHWT